MKAFENKVDLENTLFIVSSKSGSTLEPNIFKQYFFDRIERLVGPKEAGRRFIAITDPGSKMQQVAEGDGFRHVFFGWPNIGGRYSVLSDFGLVPAAIMGVDVPKFLDRTEEMVCACMPSVPVEENPGVVLGTILGVAASQFGRDKMTIVASPAIGDLGAWLEQLVAESTGKEGKGVIPIDREALGKPDVYGRDRIFVYLRLLSAPDAAQDAAVDELERAGHPVVRIVVDDPYDLGEEFFRWEIATAVAGSILGIDPFDQPDVEASKIATRKLTTEYEKRGALPAETPIFTADGIELFTDEKNAAALAKMVNGTPTLAGYLEAHLKRIGAGDYFALLAYIEMNEAHEERAAGECARAFAIPGVSRRASSSDRASCTRRDRPTRVARTRACSCRSRAMTPSMCPCRDGNTRSVWSRRPRHEGISRSWWSATAVRSASILARTSPLIWGSCRLHSLPHCGS